MILLKLSPKVIFLFLSIVMLTNQSIVNGAKLKCEYSSSTGLNGLDGQNVYYCTVINNGIFTDERVTIDSVEGQHTGQNTNSNVNGFKLGSIPSLKFFPQNLKNVFGDLLMIQLYRTNLQEVNQNNIKVFPNLRYLHLGHNKITTIDADLFKFNPELRYIALNNNQISHIDPNVFHHLNNLVFLYLSDNKCTNALSDVINSRSGVLELIQRVRAGDCTSTDELQKKKEAQEQVNKLKQAAIEEYSTKFESCQSSLTSVVNEKSTCLKQFSELEEKARETAKLNEEKIKTCEESITNLNQTNEQLREEIEQIKITNQELKTKNENLTKNLVDQQEKCESAQGKLDESRDKCEIKVLQNKLELSEKRIESNENLNEKLRQSNEKTNEWKDKYINLLHSKLTENENIIIFVN